ncbi:MAG: C25 family cysteine peptidase [Bacteroidales bacterium]
MEKKLVLIHHWKMLKYRIKYEVVFLLFCLYFSSQGQNKLHITSNDSLTNIFFKNTSVDTTLYFIIPENEADYSIIYQNPSDTQCLRVEQDFFYFRDCKGVKIRLRANCSDSNLQLGIRHVFSSDELKISPIFEASYRSLFENYRQNLFCKEEVISYLIVCYEDFFHLIDNFIFFKEKEGLVVHTIMVSKNESRDSIQEKIKRFYQSHQPTYLLLIGDDEYIPSYRLNEGLSDVPYALLEGDDDFPEMIVGRLSVGNVDDLQCQIRKLLMRDKLQFSKKAIGIASDNVSPISEKYDWEYMRHIRTCLLNKGYSAVEELYDGSQGEADAIGNPSEKDIIDLVNRGVSIINYLGYGSYDRWGTGSFTTASIEKLQNTTEYPIVISAACLNGHFADRECLAEKWMNTSSQEQASGAVLSLMFSSLVEWEAATYSQQVFNALLPHTDSTVQIGVLYLQTYMEMIRFLKRSIEAKTWVLFGDPSMSVYPGNQLGFINYCKENSITVYPNPFQTYFYIDNLQDNIKSIQLFDLRGKEIAIKTTTTNKSAIISPLNLSKSIYILKVGTEKEIFYQKIIKN